MQTRLQKILSTQSQISRRTAEALIQSGRIKVNGQKATLGQKADPEKDKITIDDKPLSMAEQKKVYIMLNKPRGYITTLKDEKGRKEVTQLVRALKTRIYPIGRLDLNSEGLLLMTNDGDFANAILHPTSEIKKEYHVTVRGEEEGLETLAEPLIIDGYKIRPAKVQILEKKEDRIHVSITIHEGRNRQIRKMCDMAGFTVLRLQRVAIGGLRLGDLKPGTWRHLTPKECQLLQKTEKKRK